MWAGLTRLRARHFFNGRSLSGTRVANSPSRLAAQRRDRIEFRRTMRRHVGGAERHEQQHDGGDNEGRRVLRRHAV